LKSCAPQEPQQDKSSADEQGQQLPDAWQAKEFAPVIIKLGMQEKRRFSPEGRPEGCARNRWMQRVGLHAQEQRKYTLAQR
jgi:hypothetical protein